MLIKTKRNKPFHRCTRFLFEGILIIGIPFSYNFVFNLLVKTRTRIVGHYVDWSSKAIPSFQQFYSRLAYKRATSEIANIKSVLDACQRDHIKMEPQKSGLNAESTISISLRFSKNLDIPDCTIVPGDRVAIIGPSGIGKTTLLRGIIGLQQPFNCEEISINGESLYDSDSSIMSTLRSISSWIPQRPAIFKGSIAENIALRPQDEIDMKLVVECTKIAYIHDIIVSMDKGYMKTIDSSINLMSGGQLQRISIARALYQKSRILVMDEPTSALDHTSESNLIDALQGLGDNIIVIYSTHRNAMLRLATKTIELG